MRNLNYIGGIAKILELPSSIQLSQNDLYFIRFRVQFSFIRKDCPSSIIILIAWGNLAHEIIKSYKVNDYILIEGHVSFNSLKIKNHYKKIIEITVTKIIPFFLNVKVNA